MHEMSLLSGARAVVANTDSVYDTSLSTAPNYGNMAEAAMNAETAKRVKKTQSDQVVAEAGLNAATKAGNVKRITKANTEIANKAANTLKMAGFLSAAGALASGVIQKSGNEKYKADRSKLDEIMTGLTDRLKGDKTPSDIQAEIDALETDPELQPVPVPDAIDPNTYDPGNVDDSPSDPGNVDDSPSDPNSRTTDVPELRTEVPEMDELDQEMARVVRGRESGHLGYEAFNQGGKKDGYEAINPGNWSKSVHAKGGTLQTMSLTELIDRGKHHNDYVKFPTQADYNAAGQVWATGAYQFIPDTLRAEIAKLGLDTTKLTYNQPTQDKIFISHARDNGIKPWRGVADASGKIHSHLSPAEKSILQQWQQRNRQRRGLI